jgi:hypothetical protein
MATVEKDFKVKNGLQVANGATFGGNVVVADPTDATHAATKSYVDSLVGSLYVGDTAPSSPVNGIQWFDTTLTRVKVYYDGEWYLMASYTDVLNIPQHIHDTSIGGSGLIVSVFTDAGATAVEPTINSIDAGGPGTTTWDLVLDGGSAESNFT